MEIIFYAHHILLSDLNKWIRLKRHLKKYQFVLLFKTYYQCKNELATIFSIKQVTHSNLIAKQIILFKLIKIPLDHCNNRYLNLYCWSKISHWQNHYILIYLFVFYLFFWKKVEIETNAMMSINICLRMCNNCFLL